MINIKDFILQSKSCYFSNGLIIKPKFGFVKLGNFNSSSIKLYLKASSSSSLLHANINDEASVCLIVFKNEQEFLFEQCDTLKLCSDKESVGEIVITKCEIINNEDDLTWKQILSNVRYTGIRLIGNKLLASSQGWLESDKISELHTLPPRSFIHKHGKYLFTSSCEILNLELKSNSESTSRKNYYQTLNFVTVKQPDNSQSKINNINNAILDTNILPKNNLVFDTDLNNVFSAPIKNKLVKTIKSNGKDYLLIKKLGIFSQNISSLLPNSVYTVLIHGKKINGNGKLKISFNYKKELIINLDSNLKDYTFKLETANDDNKLLLSLDDSGFGEILISRICIFTGELSNNITELRDIVLTQKKELHKSYFVEKRQAKNINYEHDSIREISKKFAQIYKQQIGNNNIELSVNLQVNNFSTRQWTSKIHSYVNNLNIIDPYLLYNDSNYIVNDNDIMLCNIFNLNYLSNKIFLEEMPSNYELSYEDLEKLNNIKTIITPSLIDYHKLKFNLFNTDIVFGHKPWPMIKSDPVIDDYFLYFEKDPNLTCQLYNEWQSIFPKLYIVGSNIKINKNNVFYISDYEDYSTLMSYVFGAKCIIDLPINSQYKSGLLELCTQINKNIITFNWNYATFDNVHIINNIENIKNLIDKIKFIDLNFDFDKSKEKFIKDLKDFFGAQHD